MNISPVIIDDDIHWYDEDGLYHRDGRPAIEYKDGSKWYFKHGLLHNEKGPAIENSDFIINRRLWYLNGKMINCSCQEEFERIIKLQMFW